VIRRYVGRKPAHICAGNLHQNQLPTDTFFISGQITTLRDEVLFLVHRWMAMMYHLFIEQEMVETLLIAVLLSVAFALSQLSKKLLRAYREEMQSLTLNNSILQSRLTDAFKYIGKVEENRSPAGRLSDAKM
jgi:hypothetical protein